MSPKIARLAGLGAFGACGLFVLIYAYVAYLSRHTTTGGMMTSLSVVTWIALALVVLGLIAAHIPLGKQLLDIANGRGARGV
jgi:hypothetical protein